MTKIKLCGLTRPEDIEAANRLMPDYVGFVFAVKSRRNVLPTQAAKLKALLDPRIQTVGVFVNEPTHEAAWLLNQGIIDIAQLHGSEDEAYIKRLRTLTGKPIWQAFKVRGPEDVRRAQRSSADMVLLDSGAGTGTAFDWELLAGMARPYFLAGGLDPENVGEAVEKLAPYGVDVSSGIESGGLKDERKMTAFVQAVRDRE